MDCPPALRKLDLHSPSPCCHPAQGGGAKAGGRAVPPPPRGAEGPEVAGGRLFRTRSGVTGRPLPSGSWCVGGGRISNKTPGDHTEILRVEGVARGTECPQSAPPRPPLLHTPVSALQPGGRLCVQGQCPGLCWLRQVLAPSTRWWPWAGLSPTRGLSFPPLTVGREQGCVQIRDRL